MRTSRVPIASRARALMRDAIRGNQRQSEAIREQSEALRGTPRHSDAISGNQRAIREQSEALQGHQWQSESNQRAIRGTPRHSEALQGPSVEGTFGHQPSSAVISRHQPSSAVISGRYLRSAHRRRVAASDAASSRKPITAASRHPPEEPPYDRHTCHREQSEAIRGNQRQLVAISGAPVRPTHLPSGAIRGNKRRSEALRGTLIWVVASCGIGQPTPRTRQQMPRMGCLIWSID